MADRTISSKAGLAKRGVPSPAICDGDVLIDIRPPSTVYWYGTRAQLEAEGIIPANAKWDPHGEDEWEDNRFEYRLIPIGAKRRGRVSRTEDQWRFERFDRRYKGMGSWPESIFENERERARLQIGLEICIGKRPGTWTKHWEAEKDEQFQRLLRRVLDAIPGLDTTPDRNTQTEAKREATRGQRRQKRMQDGGEGAAA